MVGTMPKNKRIEHTWIRLLGLPLHLRSPKVFREVGEVCGGWLETEEEIELKNYLKWTRIKVRGDGSSTPKTVKIESDGDIFEIQIWCETPVRFSEGEKEEEEGYVQQVKGRVPKQRVKELNLNKGGGARRVNQQIKHVGSSSEWDFNKSRDQSRDEPLANIKTALRRSLGPDSLAQVIYEENFFYKPISHYRPDPVSEEINALQFSLAVKEQNNVTKELPHRGDIISEEKNEEEEK